MGEGLVHRTALNLGYFGLRLSSSDRGALTGDFCSPALIAAERCCFFVWLGFFLWQPLHVPVIVLKAALDVGWWKPGSIGIAMRSWRKKGTSGKHPTAIMPKMN